MLDLTDRHFRYLLRQVTRDTLLYSEMITAAAVLHGDSERLLGHHEAERPLALQLAGDDPDLLARAAVMGEARGYAEVNLNVGCPSDRVSRGNFGACLMKDPPRVAAAVAAMRAAVTVPVTVKHRLGVDDMDSFEELLAFVDAVAAAGADAFTVHARKAWLSGLSPKENRTVPPLRHDAVHRLKAARPELVVELNGGVADLEEVAEQLDRVDGVMLGRAVYDDPFVLVGADELIGAWRGAPAGPSGVARAPAAPAPGSGVASMLATTRREVVAAMLPYTADRLAAGAPLAAVTRHMLSLFRGLPGGRAWRRVLTERSHLPGAGVEVLEAALAALPPGVAELPLRPARAGTPAR